MVGARLAYIQKRSAEKYSACRHSSSYAVDGTSKTQKKKKKFRLKKCRTSLEAAYRRQWP